MPQPSFAARLRAGETLFTAWSTIPDPLVAEFAARTGFDAVTLDMQHGNHSTESVHARRRGGDVGRQAGDRPHPGRPVRDGKPGARLRRIAVIAPMVNSVADAKAFAAAMKFPPLGERSWGPTRVIALHGIGGHQTYLETANQDTLAIAMIETRAALCRRSTTSWLSTGSTAFSSGPRTSRSRSRAGQAVDASNPEMLKAAGDVAAKTARMGKFPCTLAITAEAARKPASSASALSRLRAMFPT